MSVQDKLINCLISETGIDLTESMREDVVTRLNMILDLIGYSEQTNDVLVESKSVNISETGIDDKLIKYLEELSRLTLTPEEEEKAKEDLTKILGYIDTLNELDTSNVEAMSHPFSYTNNFREDEVKPSTDRELILKNAPQQKDGCFKVPTTVE
ncbi:MAG: Asp-tRNA(Asn)/Glu-tRNA(Gln) amidotransferase subunit GatC [Lachnospirales bacterium]